MSSPRMRAAQAAPTACVSWVPMGELIEVKCAGRHASWQGIWWPSTASPALPSRSQTKVTSGMPRISATPCSR